MSKYEFLAMIMLTPFVAADPPEKGCLPRPGTIVTGSCTGCLEEPIWSTLERPNPLTNAIKAMVFCYVDCYRRVQLYVVVHFEFDAR